MSAETTRIERRASRQWLRVSELQVSTNAQRKHRPHKSQKIAAGFDPEKLGVPVVSLRGGHYWIVDGQHRIGGLKIIGYDDQLIECDVYEGLSEREEAELFDGLNDSLPVNVYDKFMVRIEAQRPRECQIAYVVQEEGLRIGTDGKDITAVGALGRVYDFGGPDALGLALRMIRDSYGDVAMRGQFIEGAGLVAHRYNGQLDEEKAVQKLSALHGGFSGVMSKAGLIKRRLGRPLPHCVAAAIVEVINGGRGGQKLPDWWSQDS